MKVKILIFLGLLSYFIDNLLIRISYLALLLIFNVIYNIILAKLEDGEIILDSYVSILNYELQNENFTYSVDIEYAKNVNSLIKKINNRFNNKKSKLSEHYLFEAFSDNSTKIYERSIHFYEGYSNDLYVPLNPIESDILKTFKLLRYRWSDILSKKRYYNYKNGYIPHKLQPHIKNIEISD